MTEIRQADLPGDQEAVSACGSNIYAGATTSWRRGMGSGFRSSRSLSPGTAA